MCCFPKSKGSFYLMSPKSPCLSTQQSAEITRKITLNWPLLTTNFHKITKEWNNASGSSCEPDQMPPAYLRVKSRLLRGTQSLFEGSVVGIPLGPVPGRAPHQRCCCTETELTGKEWWPLVMRWTAHSCSEAPAPEKFWSFPTWTVDPSVWGLGLVLGGLQQEWVEATAPSTYREKPEGKDAFFLKKGVFEGTGCLIQTLRHHLFNVSIWTFSSPKFNKYLRCQLWRSKLLEGGDTDPNNSSSGSQEHQYSSRYQTTDNHKTQRALLNRKMCYADDTEGQMADQGLNQGGVVRESSTKKALVISYSYQNSC